MLELSKRHVQTDIQDPLYSELLRLLCSNHHQIAGQLAILRKGSALGSGDSVDLGRPCPDPPWMSHRSCLAEIGLAVAFLKTPMMISPVCSRGLALCTL